MKLDPHAIWYAWDGWNARLFLAINHTGDNPVWNNAARLGTALGDHHLLPVYLGLLLTLAMRWPRLISLRSVLVYAWANLLLFVSIYGVLKPWAHFPRPLEVFGPQMVHVLGEPKFAHSFPSGHAAFAMVLAASLAFSLPRPWSVVLWLFALWVAWSRIAVGAHFPADVIGGAFVGALCVLVAYGLARLWIRGAKPA
ncbi:MAG: phosphatase PAP2 family protein [Thiomonas arsenitoxydans]|uniref:Phosphatase PAP2 family protein n=1 Tax=Thiomonas arsenitoxydans (strain DSM 22701 / CIP 110005 / 3As) TaxID=426114 RepID=A0A8I1SUM9_THIA3|nr:phosphatase PAP2 family protein [Thiomonas arsenitoxydans]